VFSGSYRVKDSDLRDGIINLGEVCYLLYGMVVYIYLLLGIGGGRE